MKNTDKLIFALAIIPSLLTSCGGRRGKYSFSSNTNSSSSVESFSSSRETIEPLSLTIWTYFGHIALEVLTPVVEEIVSKNEHLKKVEIEQKAGASSDFEQVIKLAKPAGKLPDLFIYHFYEFYSVEDTPEGYEESESQRREFVSSYSLPLEGEYLEWVRQNYSESQYKNVVFNNQTWGIPFTKFDYVKRNTDEVIGESQYFLFTSDKSDYQDKNSARYKYSFQLAQQISEAYLKMNQE